MHDPASVIKKQEAWEKVIGSFNALYPLICTQEKNKNEDTWIDKGNFLYYVRITDIDDFGIVGFLLLSTFQICRFYCAEPPVSEKLGPDCKGGHGRFQGK